jgi:membrane-associated phospholipid phosphatase
MHRVKKPAWLVPLTAGSAFVLWAYIATTQRVLPADETMLLFAHGHATPALDSFFTRVTQLGDPIGVMLAALLLVAVLWNYSYSRAVLTMTVLFGASYVSVVLKLVYLRARPELWHQVVTEPSYSFPSGHAMTSLSLVALLLFLLWHSRWRLPILFGGLVYVIAIGCSRVYLGVHYPSDIVGGWLAAISWFSLVLLTFRAWKRQHRRTSPV